MATLIGIGFSQNHDPLLAYKEAAIEAKQKNGQPSNNLVLVFHTAEYLAEGAADIIEKILQPTDSVFVLTSGIILPRSVESRGVGIFAVTSDEINFSVAAKEELSFFPLQESGLTFAQELSGTLPAGQRQALCLFLGSLQVNSSPLLRGLSEGLGRAFPIFGGVSSDQTLTRSVISMKRKPLNDAIAGVLIGGKQTFAMSIRHGWVPLGRPRIVTQSDGNRIQEIDNQPAITIYEDYFHEELAKIGPGKLGDIGLLYPLGLNTDTPRQYLLRHVISVQPDGSFLCHGDVPTGSRIHLMIGDKDLCRSVVHDAAVEIREKLLGRVPKIVFIFQSIARRKLFGRAATQEVSLIKEVLGLTTNVFGMYTYGEIAPFNLGIGSTGANIHSSGIIIAAIG
jgi:hypothetical protein